MPRSQGGEEGDAGDAGGAGLDASGGVRFGDAAEGVDGQGDAGAGFAEGIEAEWRRAGFRLSGEDGAEDGEVSGFVGGGGEFG